MFTAVVTTLGASPHCTVESSTGCLLRLDARSRTEAGMVWNGDYEPDFARLLLDLAGAYGATVYDVGANVGLVAVPLARALGSESLVACFEPAANNVARLRANIELNRLGNCRVFPVALGGSEGTVHLAREAGGGATTGNAIIMEQNEGPKGSRVETVRITTLDAVVRSEHLAPPEIVKLDVEGSEVGFLMGAQETIRRSRPIILGEFNSALMPTFGTTFLDAARALPERYAVFAFAEAGALQEREPEVGLGDVLLVPREKIGRLPRAVLPS